MSALSGASAISGQPDFRKLIFRAPALLVLLLLTLPGNTSAESYWDAVFELGFDPKIQQVDRKLACNRIEKIFQLNALISDNLVIDEKLPVTPGQLQSRMTSLDVGNLHGLLPYSDSESQWRGVGIRGQSHVTSYNLSIIDPEIKEWLQSWKKGHPAKWAAAEHFGDIALRSIVRPSPNDTYRFVTEGQLNLGDLPAINLTRVIDSALIALWRQASGSVDPPGHLLAELPLDEHSKQMVIGFARDFPNLFKEIDPYIIIERIVSPNSLRGNAGVLFDLKSRFNADAFANDYPEFGKLIKKMRGAIHMRAQAFDDTGQPLAVIEVDSIKNLLNVQFLTANGHLFPLSQNVQYKMADGFNFIDKGISQFHIKCDVQINIVGLRSSIEGLKFAFEYLNKDQGPAIKVNFSETPKAVVAGGHAFGFLPVWFIDILIPSNVENLTSHFLRTLANSSEGLGAKIEFGSFQGESAKNNLYLFTEADVLANGIIKLGFNLQRQMQIDQEKIAAEIRKFRKIIWTALYQDYHMAALRKGSQ